MTGDPTAEPRIAELAMLSDAHAPALVDERGSVVWWCPPRVDAPSVLGRLLDPRAGHFRVCPTGVSEVGRRYLDDTLVLETVFRTPTGEVRLTDALALGHGTDPDRFGLDAPLALVRLVECTGGEAEVDVDFSPRPGYGVVVPEIARVPGGVLARGDGTALALVADIPLDVVGGTARGRVRLRGGDRLSLVAEHRDPGGDGGLRGADPVAALRTTVKAWRAWAARHRGYEGPYAEEVRRAVLVLRGLTHAPTGALVASATTSLPEVPGGGANWDYRYGWLRDGSLTVRALDSTGCAREAWEYLDWMRRVVGDHGGEERLQVVFAVDGTRDLSERVLGHLSGHRGNRPVRVGNGAWRQLQLDVPGEVLDAAHRLGEPDGGYDPDMRAFLGALADRVASDHRLPDSGIWEGREGERHYTVSKVMCWVALDRAVRLAPAIGAGADAVGRWARERDRVREAVLREGWHDGRSAYTGAFGSDHLDAGVLVMPLVGIVPHGDDRMRRTVAVIRDELESGGLVRRWTGADPNAGFLPCTFWLAETLAMSGDVDAAHDIVAAVLARTGPLGLLPEAASPVSGELGGNLPLAISHVALVNAAMALAAAEARLTPTGPG